MRWASWQWGGRDHVGTISPDGREATPLAVADASLGVLPLIQLLARGEPLPSPSSARLPVEVITLRAPLPRPLRSLFCVGRNYHAHAKELAGTVFRETMPQEDPWPIVFTKLPECVVGPHDTVRLPGANVSVQIDYESELAVVIGRGGRDISRSHAMDHVFGYTIVNDVTARDVQMRHQQWDLGKSFDSFCPMGPWIVTADELDGRATRVRGWVNGELRQDGLTKDMIHDIPGLIETCSRGLTLYPGDVIATGTPAGVGMGLKPPQWLKHGDLMRIEIDGIGVIENRFEGTDAMAFHLIDRIAVDDEGEGSVVICVHGLGGSSNTFTPLLPALARHRVIRIDLPGSGRSQRVEGALSIEGYVDATLRVCARLNLTRAHWVGHSMGTIVVQHIAATMPKAVASVALFGPLIAPPDAARAAMKARAAKAREGVAGMHEITTGLLNGAISADTRARLPVAVAFVRESLMRQDGDAYARSCEALAGAQAAAVEKIEAPVLLVTGDEDGVAPPQAVRAMADRLHGAKNTKVVVLPRCGHWTPIERPEECQRELREFLAANARS